MKVFNRNDDFIRCSLANFQAPLFQAAPTFAHAAPLAHAAPAFAHSVPLAHAAPAFAQTAPAFAHSAPWVQAAPALPVHHSHSVERVAQPYPVPVDRTIIKTVAIDRPIPQPYPVFKHVAQPYPVPVEHKVIKEVQVSFLFHRL